MKNKFALALLMGLLLTGCDDTPESGGGSGTDNGHSEETHLSFKDNVEQLVTIRNEIRDAFAANNPKGADDPIHHLPGLLESLEHLSLIHISEPTRPY